ATQRFLVRQEGLSFVILESAAVAADAISFAQAGISASKVLPFEREGRRPDGTAVKIGFALAFARDVHAPDIGFAVCKHRYPEHFWNPEFQNHRNTASTIAGVVLVAENPSDHHIFLSAFTGVRELHASSSGVSAPTPRGDIRIMEPAAFEDRYGSHAPDVSAGAELAALQFAVRDNAVLQEMLKASDIPFSRHMNATIVAPPSARGATLVFMDPRATGSATLLS